MIRFKLNFLANNSKISVNSHIHETFFIIYSFIYFNLLLKQNETSTTYEKGTARRELCG